MPTVDRDDQRLVFMPEDRMLAASGTVMAMRERWFVVCPERGLVFWQAMKRRQGQLRGASPQCNSSETVARAIRSGMYPWAEVRRIPLVLQPIDLGDYR